MAEQIDPTADDRVVVAQLVAGFAGEMNSNSRRAPDVAPVMINPLHERPVGMLDPNALVRIDDYLVDPIADQQIAERHEI